VLGEEGQQTTLSTGASQRQGTSKKTSEGTESSSKPGGKGEGNVAPPPQLVASQAEALAALLGSPAVSVQALDYYRIPMFLLPIYQAAAVQYGVPWQVLAAINEVETNYGNDLSLSTAGAEGWMQFMPSTWLRYGVDVQDAGYADPYNPVDAIFAAARYLRAAGAAHDLKGAIFAYNHSDAYVESVLLRAKLIAHYPTAVIETLTGLAEGSLPIAHALATAEELLQPGSASASIDSVRPGRTSSTKGRSGAASSTSTAATAGSALTPGSTLPPTPGASGAAATKGAGASAQTFSDLVAPAGAPVVAVQDGKVLRLGHSRKLGNYLILRDVYGDVFTYAGLGSIATTYAPPKLDASGQVAGIVRAGAEATRDSAPAQPATAGSQSPLTLHVKAAAKSSIEGGSVEPEGEAGEGIGKVRMYAHPGSSYAHAAIARARAAGTLYGQRKPLKQGAVVSQGTVLGQSSPGPGAAQGHIQFAISPAGDAGTVQVQPVLQSWRQLDAALHPRGAKRNSGLIGATAGDAFLLSRSQLRRAVLSDPGIGLDQCTKSDVASGAIDTRALASLVFLSRSGLKPTLGAMPCATSVKGGISLPGVSAVGPPLRSFQIVKVNGVEIAGHQGPGSIADLTIRTLLTLQGTFAPSAITSLMHYPGSPSTIDRAQQSRTIRIAFTASSGSPGASSTVKGAAAKLASAASSSTLLLGGGLRSTQWSNLVGRIGAISQPHISRKPSSAAIQDREAHNG
jgi:murein DD-endopeptidase MepM/ murein hydrolase activator NlpD